MKATRPSGLSSQRAVEPTSTDRALAGTITVVMAQTPTASAGVCGVSSPTASASAVRSASASYSMASAGRNEMTTCSPGVEAAGEAAAVAAGDAGEDAGARRGGRRRPWSCRRTRSRRSSPWRWSGRSARSASFGWMSTSSLRRRTATRATERGGLQRGAAEDLAVARPAVVGSLTDQPVAHADEGGDVLGGRMLEDALGRVVLLDAPVAHDGQAVTERERLGLVVGDEHRGEAEAAVELVDLGAHLVAQAGVEVAQRLVEQHEVGSGDEATGEGDALLLTAAELRRDSGRGARRSRRGRRSPRPTRP